ncbi:MAG: sigma-70 family RNA polymerase sigma factor [Actinobacteria bacterium]|nr:sigma-70 family RNA polymerase sigma factor [Actinomycetota bacterium]
MKPASVQGEERELVARAQQGDRDAYGELVRRHQDTVYTLAVRLVGPDLGADVAQEALIRAWRALPRFRGDASFSTWLHRITVNTAWTQRKRAARHVASELEETLVDTGPSPEHAGEMADLRRRLKAAIARLSPGQRAVVVLRDVSGWSHAEIARELGITQTTAKVRLHRARKRLQALLEEDAS